MRGGNFIERIFRRIWRYYCYFSDRICSNVRIVGYLENDLWSNTLENGIVQSPEQSVGIRGQNTF